jgi:hypothetical protein
MFDDILTKKKDEWLTQALPASPVTQVVAPEAVNPLDALSLDEETRDKVGLVKNLAGSYTPEQGGFFEMIYRNTASKPRELDEKKMKYRENLAAITDSLGLLAQMGAAFGGNNLGVRSAEDTATAGLKKERRRLEDLYVSESDQYNAGLMNAIGKDYETGYKEFKDSRMAAEARYLKQYEHELKKSIEEMKSKHNLTLEEQRRLSGLERLDKQNEYNKAKWEAQIDYNRERDEKNRAVDNARIAESARHNRANESESARHNRANESVSAQNAQSRRMAEKRLSSNGGSSNGGGGKAYRSIAVIVDDGTKGSTVDSKTGKSYISIDFSKAEHDAMKEVAKGFIEEVSKKDVLLDTQGWNDDDYIREYIKRDPNALKRITGEEVEPEGDVDDKYLLFKDESITNEN